MIRNVRVVYEPIQLKHLAVQCPKCDNWFNGWEVMQGAAFHNLRFKNDIPFAKFNCPICGENFGRDHHDTISIQEVKSIQECYKGCISKYDTWE